MALRVGASTGVGGGSNAGPVGTVGTGVNCRVAHLCRATSATTRTDAIRIPRSDGRFRIDTTVTGGAMGARSAMSAGGAHRSAITGISGAAVAARSAITGAVVAARSAITDAAVAAGRAERITAARARFV